jgi:hypothetical protein
VGADGITKVAGATFQSLLLPQCQPLLLTLSPPRPPHVQARVPHAAIWAMLQPSSLSGATPFGACVQHQLEAVRSQHSAPPAAAVSAASPPLGLPPQSLRACPRGYTSEKHAASVPSRLQQRRSVISWNSAVLTSTPLLSAVAPIHPPQAVSGVASGEREALKLSIASGGEGASPSVLGVRTISSMRPGRQARPALRK